MLEKTLSVLFEQRSAKKNIFASQIKTAFFGALPVDFWMLNFAEIQHRVASLTLEYATIFTRHHAFLKKSGENFHHFGGLIVVETRIAMLRFMITFPPFRASAFLPTYSGWP